VTQAEPGASRLAAARGGLGAGRARLGLSPTDALTWVLHTVIVAVLIWNHEPWRDELQAWSIAMTSHNPLDLLPNTRLEGRPPGWQLFLWPFARVSTSARMMQAVTLVVGSLGAWWWLRRSALAWWLKAVVLFGFLFTGGYLVHSRDYVLSFFVLVAATAVYERRGAGMRLAMVLCALAWVNAFSLAMAAAFFAAAWLPEIIAWRRKSTAERSRIVEAFVVCTGWFAWSAYLTYPTADNQFGVGKYKGFGNALTKSFIPLDYDWAWLVRIDDFLAAALLVTALAYAWWHSRAAFVFVAATLAMLLYNLTYGYGDYWWHFGNAYMVVFVATCFPRGEAAARDADGAGDASRTGRIVRLVGVGGLVVMALANLAASRYGAGRDVYANRDYSNSAPAAAQIRDICDGCTIIADWDAIGAAVSALLDNRPVYYLNRGEFGTFAEYSNKNIAPTWSDAMAAVVRFEKPILIQTAFLNEPPPADMGVIGLHREGVHDHINLWQYTPRPVVVDDESGG
jgi:hypothetical protein